MGRPTNISTPLLHSMWFPAEFSDIQEEQAAIPILSPNSRPQALARCLHFWMVWRPLWAKHCMTPVGVIFPGCGRDGTQLISRSVPVLRHCFSLLYTSIHSNFFSALEAALLQQTVTVCHRVVYSCATAVYNLCPNFQVLRCYPTLKPHVRPRDAWCSAPVHTANSHSELITSLAGQERDPAA